MKLWIQAPEINLICKGAAVPYAEGSYSQQQLSIHYILASTEVNMSVFQALNTASSWCVPIG